MQAPRARFQKGADLFTGAPHSQPPIDTLQPGFLTLGGGFNDTGFIDAPSAIPRGSVSALHVTADYVIGAHSLSWPERYSA